MAAPAAQIAAHSAHERRMRIDRDRLLGVPAKSLVLALPFAAAIILYWLGRLPICACGTVKLWHGQVMSSENSQHLTDWYTYSHVLHGFLFYALFWWLTPGWTFIQRLAAAVAIECGWEILENTPLIIDRYRAATMSLDYYGDSIINSLSDIGAMMVGFWLASILPVGVTIAIGVFFEVFTGYFIRDNLTLNVLMLVHPIDAVKAWQSAAPG